MPRLKRLRHIGINPRITYYKPEGVAAKKLNEVILHFDELEALRLADLENYYHEDAAEKMNISRQTFGRILESAHQKVAHALIHGKAIRIEGGNVQVST